MSSDVPLHPPVAEGEFEYVRGVVERLRAAATSEGVHCADIDWLHIASGMSVSFAMLTPHNVEHPGYTVVALNKMDDINGLIDEPRDFWIYITAGVLHAPVGDRLAQLEVCNRWCGEYPNLPSSIHPETGDILVQTRVHISDALRSPHYFSDWAINAPHVAGRIREDLAKAGVSGEPHRWSYACALGAISISGTQMWTGPVGGDDPLGP